MLNSFKQYFVILANALIGIAFGYACFYLILNLYHYQEIRRVAYIDFENNASIKAFDEKLQKIESNISKFDSNNYKGELSYGDASKVQMKLKQCVSSFRNDTFTELRKENLIDIKDVYKFSESLSNDVLNDCIVFQLYELTTDNFIDNEYIEQNKKMLQYYMDDLLQDGSYLKKDLGGNSSYFYNTDITNSMVKNDVRDGFYEVLSSYQRALNFVELISDWFIESGRL